MIVLIVDDGQYIVEYLKHLLDWSKFGVEQVMTTTNSIKAKEILLQSAIDILITDIRMPEVSGIDLLEFVGTMKMKTKVIFLSGYSEFEYAQKAIRLGLFDYLLKPVDKEDMEKVMRDVIKSIEDSRIEAGTLWNSADGLNYLISAISGNESLIQICTPLQSSFEHRKMRFFKCTLADELNEINLQDTLRNLDAFVWIFPPSAFGMISESGAEKLKAALSSIDLSESFYLKNKQVVRQIFYQFLYCEEVTPADFHFLQNAEEFSKLELGEWECARKRIQNRYPQWTSRKHKIIYLLEVANYLYFTTDKVYSEQFLDWLINRLGKPIEVYESIIFAISRLCQEKEMMPVENIVETIRTYISGHLDEALSLEELGQIVHLHPVYLSKFYKQNTGENLSGYITMKRLERAARLLIESNLHVVDIARMVGYRKAQYFIKLFKDLYGVTPQIYRQNHTKQRLNFMK